MILRYIVGDFFINSRILYCPPKRSPYYYHYEATELGDLSNSKDLTENSISCVSTHCLIQSSWTDGEVGIMICILCVKVQRPKDIKELVQSSTDDKWKSWNQNLWSTELVPTFIPRSLNITSISDFPQGISAFPHVIHGVHHSLNALSNPASVGAVHRSCCIIQLHRLYVHLLLFLLPPSSHSLG